MYLFPTLVKSPIPLVIVILSSYLLLFGCGKGNSSSSAGTNDTAETIYKKAQAAEKAGNMISASKLYSQIDQRFPYSPLAIRAQLRGAYVLYKAERYSEANAAIERFIQLNPGNERVPYAYYLKALTEYDQILDVSRDQKHALLAKEYLEELIRRFPKSRYVERAKEKINLTVDQLAGKEMHIGRYYQKSRHYLASINRFREVVDKYERTAHVQEALFRLTESYLALGVDQEAQSSAAVLGRNYPRSKWYRESYKLLRKRRLSPKAFEGSWLTGKIR